MMRSPVWPLFAVFLAAGCGSGPKPTDPTDEAPASVSVSPSSGEGRSQVFNAVYSHPVEGKSVVSVFLLIEKAVTGTNACFVEYNSRDNTVNLMTDDGKWQTAVKAGSAGSLSNSQCAIDAAGVRGTVQGKELTATIPVAFKEAYAGSKGVFLCASGLKKASPWERKGAWTIP